MRVTVEFFKETGKWYTTEEIQWIRRCDFPPSNFEYSLHCAIGNRLDTMYALAIDNPEGIPLMLKPGERYSRIGAILGRVTDAVATKGLPPLTIQESPLVF